MCTDYIYHGTWTALDVHVCLHTGAAELTDWLQLVCQPKLQALVYDILPSTTAVFSYAIGSRKLSANEQFLLVLKQ